MQAATGHEIPFLKTLPGAAIPVDRPMALYRTAGVAFKTGRGRRPRNGLQIHPEKTARGVAGGLFAGQPLDGPGEIAGRDVAVEFDLDGSFRRQR